MPQNVDLQKQNNFVIRFMIATNFMIDFKLYPSIHTPVCFSRSDTNHQDHRTQSQ